MFPYQNAILGFLLRLLSLFFILRFAILKKIVLFNKVGRHFLRSYYPLFLPRSYRGFSRDVIAAKSAKSRCSQWPCWISQNMA